MKKLDPKEYKIKPNRGDSWIWVSACSLSVSLLLVGGVIGLILFQGLGYFWPSQVFEFKTRDDGTFFGELITSDGVWGESGNLLERRLKIKRGNRDVFGQDFVWINESSIVSKTLPVELTVFERTEWGNFYGIPTRLKQGNLEIAAGEAALWSALNDRLAAVHQLQDRIYKIEKVEIGRVNFNQERLRLKLKELNREGVTDGAPIESISREQERLTLEYNSLEAELQQLRSSDNSVVEVRDPSGLVKEIALTDIVSISRPNSMGAFEKIWWYIGSIFNFIFGAPREANTEGGIWPALFGTVMMVFVMSIVVTPLGVIAAIYLREYAKQGPLVSMVRIAVNNLAGVPSIVFGVFGVGFFIYFLGGSIDQLFFQDSLPAPTFGTGGILWSALTLALLTVPTVIVATEEGLAAIPGHWRQAAYALGATKFETVTRVVLPALVPAILTGVILSISRAAGEVAPLMITGVVKLAPSMPLDSYLPFLHLERKFMHLGFHIYDLGFQSPNVDAAMPMLFATTLVLLLLVFALNLIAVLVRNRLQRRLLSSAM